MNQDTRKSALIIGASRGLGLGLVEEYLGRQWQIVATERQPQASSRLSSLAAKADGALEVLALDVNTEGQIDSVAKALAGRQFDLLFVVAGVSNDPAETVGQISRSDFEHVMVTNALSPMRVLEQISGLVRPEGTLAVMSSALGSVSGNTDGGYEVYRASKAALNTLMRSYAARAGAGHSLLALMPGWVRTDMGGPDAPVDVPTSAKGLADTIAAHAGQPGLAFVDYQDQPIAW